MSLLMQRLAGTSLHQHAADNLRFIRDTMARAGRFTAVPGWGAAGMGVTAIATALIAGPPSAGSGWLTVWLADALVAAAIGAITMARKARRLDSPLADGAGRQFALALLPALVAGVILTMVFVAEGLTTRLPGGWLVTYGAAVSSAGALSIRPVRVVGYTMLGLGALAFLVPPTWGNVFMALGFGVVQIVGGIAIGRAHNG